MQMNVLFSVVLGAALFASGCTRSGQQPVQVENPKTNNGATQDDGKKQEQPAVDTSIVPSGEGEASMTLDEHALKSAYSIDTSNLTYRFEYLTKVQNGSIVFDAAGKATLQFKDLPSEQSGTVKLELLQAGVVKLAASQDNVVLKKGQNNPISLKLRAVDSGTTTPNSTDLSIDVTLENPNGGGTTPTQPTQPTQPADPIADWNGKEHKGNSKWQIISVQ